MTRVHLDPVSALSHFDASARSHISEITLLSWSRHQVCILALSSELFNATCHGFVKPASEPCHSNAYLLALLIYLVFHLGSLFFVYTHNMHGHLMNPFLLYNFQYSSCPDSILEAGQSPPLSKVITLGIRTSIRQHGHSDPYLRHRKHSLFSCHC